MKKIFNYRPLIIVFLGLLLGVFLSSEMFCYDYSFVFIFALIILLLIVVCVIKLRYRIVKQILLCLIAVMLGIIVVSISFISYNVNKIDEKDYYVRGRINTVVSNASGVYYILDNVKVTTLNYEHSFGLNHKAIIYSFNNNDCIYEIGDVFEIKCKIDNATFRQKINYSTYSKYDVNYELKYIEVNNKNANMLTIFDKIKIKVLNILKICNNQENADLIYGMLFGDTSNISFETKESFSVGGIAHLLAVSGLHVGFVTLLFSKLFNLLRINKKLRFYIISAVLFLYAFMCGFSPSITRAFLMSTICLFASAYRKQYDGLTALTLSAIVIIIINPFALYGVGFQLSFLTVFGILNLMPVLNSGMSKIMSNNLSSSISLAFSAQIGSIPLLMTNFQSFSLYSIITNLIVVPIATLVFMSSFLIIVLSFIFPSLSIYLIVPEYCMNVIRQIALFVKSLPYSLLTIKMGIVVLIFYIPLIFILGDYSFIRTKNKLKILFIALLFIIPIILLYNLS